MKLGVFTVLYGQLTLEETIIKLKNKGVQSLEIGCGGHPGKAHLNPEELLSHPEAIDQVLKLVADHGMDIAALSCHGNPVHPDQEQAQMYHKDFEQTVLLAQKLGVDTVVTFSGCPGDYDGAKYPNWVTCSWPEDYVKILEYQWEEQLIPYWKKAVAFAQEHGVTKIALEMHPGFCVYNPSTLLRLREAVGETIGANFDPSHLFWQGINPTSAIKALKGAIYHFHAKDTRIDERNNGVNGVLDQGHYGDLANRSWLFRTVGYGHGREVWNDMISMLKTVGYDGVISIEHEDALMSIEEGLDKAIAFLKDVIIFEEPTAMWWA